jgi:hypothetical protein
VVVFVVFEGLVEFVVEVPFVVFEVFVVTVAAETLKVTTWADADLH